MSDNLPRPETPGGFGSTIPENWPPVLSREPATDDEVNALIDWLITAEYPRDEYTNVLASDLAAYAARIWQQAQCLDSVRDERVRRMNVARSLCDGVIERRQSYTERGGPPNAGLDAQALFASEIRAILDGERDPEEQAKGSDE